MITTGNIILASASPRRQELLREAGFTFEVLVKNVDENYSPELKREEVALFLANKKASAYNDEVNNGFTVITADTIVCVDEKILNKPANAAEAFAMLTDLSDRTHDVITAVCIRHGERIDLFAVTTVVEFKKLTAEEINFYIENYKPFDKAGAYGIQEWIGLVAVTKITGSFYNVVGLPVSEVYDHLTKINN